MNFYRIKEKTSKNGLVDIYPSFEVRRSKDLMVRGKAFYAIWDERRGLWSTDEYDVQRIVDEDLLKYREEREPMLGASINLKLMRDFSSGSWLDFQKFIKCISDSNRQLDESLTFQNTEVKKNDYVSRRLPYNLEKGDISAYEELMSTLYADEERAKIEWAIGSIISGESKTIHKFIVLYGEAGTGKSTVLNIIQKLFEGYYTSFEAKALANNSNQFSTEVFKTNPLVAIQHDGDLSRIEDNTKLNSIISHEDMTMNEKYKASYTSRINAFLFMGTNKPVKITDAKSGIIRRLIDVIPTGKKIPTKKYFNLIQQIEFELGAIAQHCLEVYQEMGKNYYSGYRPLAMMMQTDVFFNYVESYYETFKEQDGISLKQAYEMYKQYCEEALVDFKLPRHKFREELKNYFEKFQDQAWLGDKQIRSYYSVFLTDKFRLVKPIKEDKPLSLVLDSDISLLDKHCSEFPAQYASSAETPITAWSEVKTKLSDIDTTRLHYVKLPLNHIVIDFDLKDEKGEKNLEKNLEAASKWPATYSELSKSGAGVHLHYIWSCDVGQLSRVFAEGVEVKIFTGNSSLRRRLTKCNTTPIRTLSSGLKLKGEKVINVEAVNSERHLRELIKKNLRKEIHAGTKPSIDFIYKLLEDAYKSGMNYDLSDLQPTILNFAINSTNQSKHCIDLVGKMYFKSNEISKPDSNYSEEALAFFDVEVFPNLFIVVWKSSENKEKIRMINPTPAEIEHLLRMRLVGFNCRRYDNHMLYARYIGYNNQQLYELSQRIMNKSKSAFFGEAYNISYTDIYDFASSYNKKSLKKFEIELGIHHQELGLPWDQPVPEEKWELVADYCCNDVDATEATFYHLAGDWAARQILASLSGLTVNDTTNQHTIQIILGDRKNHQDEFIYTDLSEMFPDYTFDHGKSMYRGEEVGEGGYVHAEPGMYGNTAQLDIGGQHPTSIEELNLFGKYTKNYSELKKARMAIKHKNMEALKTLLDGKLIPFIEKAKEMGFTLKDVSNALKTALTSAYGLTSATFPNPLRDPRNKDNIVAKRGALFMIDLKHEVQKRGFTVAHIKTDSIKIPDATPEIINFVMEFGRKYGYEFEHELTFDKFCLLNGAVYVGKVGWSPDKEEIGKWTSTGKQLIHPYVFKKLFSKESIEFKDLIETKSVSTSLYLDMNENLEEEHDYVFVGRVGAFCPIQKGRGGGELYREKDGKFNAADGTKGYRWMEAETIKLLGKEKDIDESYYIGLVDEAVKDISKFGDVEWFLSDDPYQGEFKNQTTVELPWKMETA